MAELSGVELEVFRHALAGVAEEMGVALRRAAYSPNIKERADCSAAVFDPDGQMVAQAEHIPVHLGAMPASVRAVLDTYGALQPGQQVCVNDPYLGGTHLPDLTIVAAVGAVGESDGLLGYVANRAHHADVGGAAPGSMPATATEIAMEGIRIPPILIADAGGERDDVVRLIAANSRTPGERRGPASPVRGQPRRGAAATRTRQPDRNDPVARGDGGCLRLFRPAGPHRRGGDPGRVLPQLRRPGGQSRGDDPRRGDRHRR